MNFYFLIGLIFLVFGVGMVLFSFYKMAQAWAEVEKLKAEDE